MKFQFVPPSLTRHLYRYPSIGRYFPAWYDPVATEPHAGSSCVDRSKLPWSVVTSASHSRLDPAQYQQSTIARSAHIVGLKYEAISSVNGVGDKRFSFAIRINSYRNNTESILSPRSSAPLRLCVEIFLIQLRPDSPLHQRMHCFGGGMPFVDDAIDLFGDGHVDIVALGE